jgi:hypothetical protein
MSKTAEVLQSLLQEIEITSKKNTVRVIFDLDSTLFNVAPRFSRIIKDFCADQIMRQKYPMTIQKLELVEVTHHPYYLKEFMQKIGLTDEPKEFYKEVFEYWRERFFRDDYVVFDEPEIGAVEFVNKLYNMNAHIIYLTGRDEPRMKMGTIESLKKWNFPLEPKKADLVLKPLQEMDDAEFKRDHFKIFPENEKIWFFETEPVNIQLVLRDCPHVKIIFFDSVHSGKAPAPEGLITIKSFQH